jgi:hypothetical protein
LAELNLRSHVHLHEVIVNYHEQLYLCFTRLY